MTTGYVTGGVDIDTLFLALDGSPGSLTGYEVNGTDLNGYFHPYTTGAKVSPATGIQVGGVDLVDLFQNIDVPLSTGTLTWTTAAQSCLTVGNGSTVGQCYFQIETDGSVTNVANGNIEDWGSGITDNTDFEWRWTAKSGDTLSYSTGTQNTWYTCDTVGKFGFAAASGSAFATVTIEFRKAGGTAISKVCSIDRDIGG